VSSLNRQKIHHLDEEVLFNQLKELAENLGIEVCNENISLEESSGTGGLCRIKGKYTLFIHSHVSMNKRIQVMIQSLRKFDLENIYVKPAIRKLLDEFAEED
jgi:hypothetical protein